MKKLSNAIGWFDIPVLDMQRAIAFYSTILEVELQRLTFPNGLQISVFPVEEGTVSGALSFYPGQYKPSKEGSLVYLNGNPDLQAILDKVENSGGKILMPKSLISEHWGHMALLEDTEGNRVALHSKK
jgi:uncharacterized protein